MKNFCLIFFLLAAFQTEAKIKRKIFNFDHDLWDEILHEHVEVFKNRTLFNYKKLKENPLMFEKYLSKLASVKKSEFSKLSKNDQLAFLINTYNAYIIKSVIDNYPLRSIKELKGTFSDFETKKIIPLFDNKISLLELAQDYIFKNSKKPEVIFALSWPTLGHPQLLSESYKGKLIKNQLTKAKSNFLKNSENNYYDLQTYTLWLSPILEENKKLFTSKKVNLAQYVAKDVAQGPYEKKLIVGKKSKIKFVELNWQLNEWVK